MVLTTDDCSTIFDDQGLSLVRDQTLKIAHDSREQKLRQ